jgi:hypothetical protein
VNQLWSGNGSKWNHFLKGASTGAERPSAEPHLSFSLAGQSFL